MFATLGRFSYRYRWQVIFAWLLVFVASIPFLPHVSSVLAVGGFSSQGTQSARAQQILESQIPGFSPSDLVVIYHDPQRTANSPSFIADAEKSLKLARALPHVTGETTFLQNPAQVSADGHTAYTLVHLDLPSEQAQRLVAGFRGAMQPTNLEVRVAGGPAFYADIETVTERDLRRAEIIAIPFALIALVLVFGSLVTAGIPLAVGGISVSCVLGSIFLIAHVVDLSIFVLNLATLLGLGLAIDYSLFMTSRFREELSERSVPKAVEITVATAGKAVFFSGLTVLIGLSGLAVFDFMFLRSVGVAGALVALFAVLGALTLLPAVLGIIGTRVDRLSIYRRRDDSGSFWHRLAD
ncbi:MAG TPA: MMPL family transporter, partial [Nitrolancea sp.]|nr:MMPL family transporter [Nitrolancea sp.]